MVFVFDLDDTLSETDEYSMYYISKFFIDNALPYSRVAEKARFAEMYFDWSRDVALEWYKKYGDDMMLEFPCKKGAVDFVNRLYDLGHKIVIATARATDWHVDPEGITLKWLKDNGIKYHSIYVGRIDKEKICEIEDADIFIDDDLKTCERVSSYFKSKSKNKNVFLATTNYNREFELKDGVKRFVDFKELDKEIFNDGIML